MPVWGIHAVHIRTQYLDMFDLYIFVAHSFNFVEPQVLPLPSYDTKDQVALVVFGGARLDTSAAWPFSLVDAALVIFCRVYTLGAQESIRFNNYWREKSGESENHEAQTWILVLFNEGKKVSVAECCKYFVQIRESGNSNVFEGNPLWDLEHRKASEHCRDPQFEESKRLMTDNSELCTAEVLC